jgi:hypothetical protein
MLRVGGQVPSLAKKNNEGLKSRRYLFAPMEYQGRIAIIKITVKEYHTDENKLYESNYCQTGQKRLYL